MKKIVHALLVGSTGLSYLVYGETKTLDIVAITVGAVKEFVGVGERLDTQMRRDAEKWGRA